MLGHFPRWIFILLAGVVLIALCVGYELAWHQPRFILALEPVGEGRAIVCSRERDELSASATSIGLFDIRSGWIWRRNLPPDPTDAWFAEHPAVLARVAPREGLLVHDGRAFVRVPGDAFWTKGVVSAYAVDDGKLLWRTTVEGLASGDSFFDISAAGSEIFVGAGTGMTAFDAATGTMLWRAPLDYQYRSSFSRPTGVMSGDDNHQTWITDLKTGARHVDVTNGRACFIGGDILYFDRFEEHPRLMARRLGNSEERVAISELTLPGIDARPSIWGCGHYRDRWFVMIGFSLEAPDAILEIDLAAGRQVAFRRLRSMVGPSPVDAVTQSQLVSQFPENAPWTGELPRHVPLLLTNQPGATSLVIVDLEESGEPRRGYPAANLDHALIMKHGDSFTISAYAGGVHTLARLDGKTGALTGASCSTSNLAPMKPFDRHGDELWLHTSNDSMPFAVLRGDALSPIFQRHLTVEDCRARTSESWFGH